MAFLHFERREPKFLPKAAGRVRYDVRYDGRRAAKRTSEGGYREGDEPAGRPESGAIATNLVNAAAQTLSFSAPSQARPPRRSSLLLRGLRGVSVVWFGRRRYCRRRVHRRQDFVEQLPLLQISLGGRHLFMPEVVIAVTSVAADLRRLAVHQRHDQVVRDSAAPHAVVVDLIA